jgi:hypothetical protein
VISTEKPGTPSELVHVGVKGMKWGVRKQQIKTFRAEHKLTPKQKSIAKKIAIGVGVSVVAVGAAFVAYKLSQNRSASISALKTTAKGAEATKTILKTQGDIFAPDPKLLAGHRETLRQLGEAADWSVDWVSIAKQHGSL